MFDLDTLNINPNNPFPAKNEESIDDLMVKLKRNIEYLEARPIVYDSENGNMVLAGNKRLEALRKLGINKVPVKYVFDAKDWTEEQRREFIYADNWNVGEWKMEFVDEDMAEEYGIEFEKEIDMQDDSGEPVELKPTLTITFDSPEELQKAENDIQELIDRKYPKSYYSIRCN